MNKTIILILLLISLLSLTGYYQYSFKKPCEDFCIAKGLHCLDYTISIKNIKVTCVGDVMDKNTYLSFKLPKDSLRNYQVKAGEQ